VGLNGKLGVGWSVTIKVLLALVSGTSHGQIGGFVRVGRKEARGRFEATEKVRVLELLSYAIFQLTTNFLLKFNKMSKLMKLDCILEDSIFAILFKFTANAVSFACRDMLFRPYPLARSSPWKFFISPFFHSWQDLSLYFSLNSSVFCF
jgi:hypothetical protein